MDLHEIVDRIVEGDTRAFARLVKRYRDMAFGYALTLLDHEQMAEDVVQEALILAYTHLDRLKEPHAFGAWLRGIVRHRSYHAQRVDRHTVSMERMETIASDEHDPARQAQNRVVREQVRAAIMALTPAQQELVQLYYEAGLSQQQIATRLDLTVSAVNMRLHTVRTRLRRRLQLMTDTDFQLRNTGRVQESYGPVVTIQFAPNAVPPHFSRLAADDKDDLCVIQHLTAGRIQALAPRATAIWTPGQEIVDTGQPFTGALDLATIQRCLDTQRPAVSGAVALESGIKTIDVFAPLTQGGRVGLFAEWGLGVLVLIPELLHHLDREDAYQTIFTFMPPIRDVRHWQEVVREISTGTRNLPLLYLPVADPIAPEFVDALQNLDSTLVLSRRLAEQAIWPCLDPLESRSRRLDRAEADPQHTEVVAAVRELLRNYYTLQFASGEKARHTLSQEQWQLIQRGRKALRFLSQPFFVAEPYTSKPGVSVSFTEALQGFADIVSGRHDATSKEAFYMVGSAPNGT